MNENSTRPRVGYACAYTPVALIDAAGFSPYRVLPVGEPPDEAGRLLHDNLCPHVKIILDRALADDLPELAGMVFMNSCDAMRRLSDAWARARPEIPSILLDLPTSAEQDSAAYFAGQLRGLTHALEDWGGAIPDDEALRKGVARFNRLCDLLAGARGRQAESTLAGGSPGLQTLYDRCATSSLDDAVEAAEAVAATPDTAGPTGDEAPVFLFGNVLPGAEVFELLESCGARVAGEDLCTGSRQFLPVSAEGEDPLLALAASLLTRLPCARTIDPCSPGQLASIVLEAARKSGARGVICHTLKFCDPYLARIPYIRETLRAAGLPFLLLEGDCTLRSLGQHRTRIEAFAEMLR